VRLLARVLAVASFGVAFVALPFTTAGAAKGENNKGGSDRSEEVRQDDRPDRDTGGNRDDGVTEDNDSDGVPNNVPDDGDNKHPSGRDRSVENGNSGNQGNSPSDPDGMSNGGADKPGGTGGVDQHDQDGNNGCGNDDDFEDDNNGKCLGRQDQSEAAPSEAGAPQPNALTGGVVRPLSLALEAPVRMSSPTRLALEAPVLRSSPTSVMAFAIRDAGSAPELVEDAVVESASLRNDTPNALSSVGGGGSVLGSEGSGLLPLSGAAIGLLALAGVALVAGGGSLARWARARAR
jgi:hypothetical protein